MIENKENIFFNNDTTSSNSYNPKNDDNSDENVIPRIQLIFLCIYVALLGICIYYIVSRKSNGLRCQIIEYFSSVLFIFILSLILFISNWISIIHFSKEIKYVDLFGNIFFILGNGLFLLLLLIIGQGYTNSHLYGTNVFQRILNYLITLSMIGLSWTIYIIFSGGNGSNSKYEYYLDNPAGYVLVSLYGVIICYFIFSNYLYRRDEIDNQKKKLILIFTSTFLNWFLLHPIVIIIAHFIDPFVKYRVVTILNLSINTIFFIILLYLFRPKLNHNYGHFLNRFLNNNNNNNNNDDDENIDIEDGNHENNNNNTGEDVDDYNVASSSSSTNEKKSLLNNNNNNSPKN